MFDHLNDFVPTLDAITGPREASIGAELRFAYSFAHAHPLFVGHPTFKSPGQSDFKSITLERGVTHDLAFEAWAAKVWQINAGLGKEVSLKDFRKDFILEFLNESGQVAIAYKIYGAWVSEYQALPELDANANAVALQHIVLEIQGWERDTSVQEPTEISYTSTAA
jgi:phage tail-like protein